jgi:hypothetical protein
VKGREKIMKFQAVAVMALAAALVAGCRREDVREFTLRLPDLDEAKKGEIAQALSGYGGVDKTSYRWDMEARTLTLRYDSMQIAKENIRQAIEAKQIKVER